MAVNVQKPHEMSALIDTQPRLEAQAVHWSIQQQRCGDAIMAQGRNEGRGLPVAVWHFADEPCAAFPPTIATSHVRRRGGFIDEHKASRVKLGLLSAPCPTRRSD